MGANEHKRLVVLGAAESGIGAALLGKQQGWDVFVSDGGTIKDKYKQELQATGIDYEEKTHTEEKILNADCVVKSPGISDKVAIVKKVRAAALPPALRSCNRYCLPSPHHNQHLSANDR